MRISSQITENFSIQIYIEFILVYNKIFRFSFDARNILQGF
jgi:hypothetical protein